MEQNEIKILSTANRVEYFSLKILNERENIVMKTLVFPILNSIFPFFTLKMVYFTALRYRIGVFSFLYLKR